jgi:hypothetical protein
VEIVLKNKMRPTLPVLVLAILFKVTLAITLVYLSKNDLNSPIYLTGDDTKNYITPLENLYSEGRLYTSIGAENQEHIMRMPGFLPFYLPLRFFLEKKDTLNSIVIIQCVFDAVSSLLMASLVSGFFIKRRKRIFWLVLIILLISTYNSIYNIYILSESLSTSLYLMATYFLIKVKSSSIRPIFGGILMGISVFLKPYFLALLLISALYYWFSIEKEKKLKLKDILYFLSPTLFFLVCWNLYNISEFDFLVKIQAPRGFRVSLDDENAAKHQFMELCRITGNDYVSWEPTSLAYSIFNPKVEHLDKHWFPESFFNQEFSLSSLDSLRHQYFLSESMSLSNQEDTQIKITTEIRNALENFKQKEPFQYHVLSRIKVTFLFFKQSPAYNFPFPLWDKQTYVQKTFKVFYSLLFYIVLVTGLLGIISSIKLRLTQMSIFLSAFAFIIFLFPVVRISCEHRYFVLAYVMLIPFSAITIDLFLHNFQLRKINPH